MSHSAVIIRFHTNGTTYEVSQCGYDDFILSEPQTLAAGIGKLVITVDGKPLTWEISHGAVLNERVVRYCERGWEFRKDS